MAPPKLNGQLPYQSCRRLFQQQALSRRTFTTSSPSFSDVPKQTSRFAKKTETQVPPVNQTQPKPNVVVNPPAAPTTVPKPSAVRRPGVGTPTMKPKQPVDINSKEYKRVARKVTSLMVALPFLIVTSYYLWDRLSLGRPVPPPSDDASSAPSSEPKKA
ncbi:hypothetical protein QC761_504060 [Podospora bellae-mahoneyi]|uniref:Uncharacterized protein n=1 Tax=Podospora bellae-mahoneyi TaxID=2093777 RepID=A0ABR0FFZ9_9PEZI|nr:hypothetical protein QC761_504060 [Podospora bellae-mahoneyi]